MPLDRRRHTLPQDGDAECRRPSADREKSIRASHITTIFAPPASYAARLPLRYQRRRGDRVITENSSKPSTRAPYQRIQSKNLGNPRTTTTKCRPSITRCTVTGTRSAGKSYTFMWVYYSYIFRVRFTGANIVTIALSRKRSKYRVYTYLRNLRVIIIVP